MPLFDPPRHDSAETIRRALNLGVNVKMITGATFFLRLWQFLLTCLTVRHVSKNFFFISDDLLFDKGLVLAGDQLAIGKETGRRLGMGTNMYPSSSLLGTKKDETIAALPVDELIEKADGFAGVFPGTFPVKNLFLRTDLRSTSPAISLQTDLRLCRTQVRNCEAPSREKTCGWHDW